MLKYNIQEGNGGRIVQVTANDLMRYTLLDVNGKPLHWHRVGGQAVAVTTGAVAVYRKPTATEIHREYMAHNARGHWLGSKYSRLPRKFERLITNLSEKEATI
jgi:hypothetical protein